ncbi:hypothetical protein IscW_ISCW007640 [Ixodes scapularis]|uniref:WH1 domain-containing protein n=1 Tax=Ixodes scapularis TaxID=6945 RepID=B7PSM2_IXOSC|nr:hypothetical protein IscW_ISCW007640 [Ixodes scapularis]|eukprot:XP_002402728.1 hypothetical protein IscW_ISCW007640 [Ixodes scapularis]
MGNKLSCSCAPLVRKGYRYEDTPWQNTRRRDGHLLRLWAEVFHVSGQGGAVKWQQVSEDLVPVNITCVQDTPDCVFHITAYNSQVDKILDVRLVQPGTRLGQASECFVYWKDSHTGDTWGLNFTSPLDAKQFRECCSPAFKFSRKASSSYSLKLEPPKQKSKSSKRKPQSTPSSPSRGRAELQCTCMTAENLHRARNGRVRYTGGAATLPRAQQQAVSSSSARPDAHGGGRGASATASRAQAGRTKTSQASTAATGGSSTTTTAASVHGGTSAAARGQTQGSTHHRRAAAAASGHVTFGAPAKPGVGADGVPRPPAPVRVGKERSLERSVGLDLADGSPPSDHFLYDNLCYATTPPSSSNESSSDEGGHGVASSADQRGRQPHEESPTSKLLMEYETHLRNALARGLDAESYSLHTFEALLTQSMENVGRPLFLAFFSLLSISFVTFTGPFFPFTLWSTAAEAALPHFSV